MVAVATVGIAFAALRDDPLDPARAVVVPCEVINSVPQVPRAVLNLQHVTNKCGFVGTDIEFQSRRDSSGKLHDYAFVGTMGAGPRIFDITDPTNPLPAGGYNDAGWENDVQVRGDIMVNTFDGVDNEPSAASACLRTKDPVHAAGVDIIKLNFNAQAAADPLPVPPDFSPTLVDCVTNAPGGAHNVTIAPNGQFLAISNCCSDFAIDIVDLRPISQSPAGAPKHVLRLIDSQHVDSTTCPTGGGAVPCFSMKKPNGTPSAGTWRPHDIFFSQDSQTMFVAAINSTWIVQMDLAQGTAKSLAFIPNNLNDPIPSHNIAISHQADTTADGKILIISDERGGGLSETGCLTDPDGVLGGLHLFALAPIEGAPQTASASLTNPVKLGDYFTPAPTFSQDPLDPALASLRIERGCTIHVFRWGGNGTSSPGEIAPGFDGVSRLPIRQATSAHYGAGTWWIDISAPKNDNDGVKEDPRTTWGNTRGWIVMPGADTWSAKEYRGYVFTGDMGRGFDVFKFTPASPTNVSITSFAANRLKTKGACVTWRTAVENNLLGFNVFRVQGKKQTKINRAIVPAKASGKPGGARYSLADPAAKKKVTYTYRLQTVDLAGARTFVKTTPLKAKAVTLCGTKSGLGR